MSDPLEYMNRFCQWEFPPKPNKQWEKTLAHACDVLACRDAEIERLRARCLQLTDIIRYLPVGFAICARHWADEAEKLIEGKEA